MSKDFEEFHQIVKELMDAYSKHPELDVESVIYQVVDGMGLDEAIKTQIKATNDAIDDFQEKHTELKEAKREGKSTAEWLGEKLEQTINQDENATYEDKQKAFDKISEALDMEQMKLITEEDNNSN